MRAVQASQMCHLWPSRANMMLLLLKGANDKVECTSKEQTSNDSLFPSLSNTLSAAFQVLVPTRSVLVSPRCVLMYAIIAPDTRVQDKHIRSHTAIGKRTGFSEKCTLLCSKGANEAQKITGDHSLLGSSRISQSSPMSNASCAHACSPLPEKTAMRTEQ